MEIARGEKNTLADPFRLLAPCGAAAFKRCNLCCDSLELAALNELVAQLVEQRPFKAWVVRSSRTELTTSFESLSRYRAKKAHP